MSWIQSPRRKLIEELYEKFCESRRELWKLCPCADCRPSRFHPTLPIPLLPGQAVEEEKVVPCKTCKGNGFVVDWENEL
jgi:hypothetical protein